MARFYRLSLEPSLFGDYAVSRNWGRIGTLGRTRVDLFGDEISALQHFLQMTKRKKSRGYLPNRARSSGPSLVAKRQIPPGSEDTKFPTPLDQLSSTPTR